MALSIQTLKKNIGLILAIGSLLLYIVLLFTFLVFLTTMFLIGLVVVLPMILIAVIRKDKNLTKRRVKASCWALGFFVLIILPAFWLIPQQIYVRTNRQETLITPDHPLVDDFAKEFLDDNPEYNNSLSFKEKAKLVDEFIAEEIKWSQDYETYGMAGHVATPAQVIETRIDDCQGQAVTLASLLLNLDFKYVWVVETPYHWYVIVRDPKKGELPNGWEKNVETLQEDGDVLALNRDGQGGMPEYRLEEIFLIFNDEETLYPVGPLESVYIGWTATGFYVHELFPIFQSFRIILLIVAMFALALPLAAWTYYMSSLEDTQRKKDRETAAKKLFSRVFIIGPLLFLVFIFWYLTQNILWDYTLVIAISEISFLSILSSEPKFWKLLKLDKD